MSGLPAVRKFSTDFSRKNTAYNAKQQCYYVQCPAPTFSDMLWHFMLTVRLIPLL